MATVVPIMDTTTAKHRRVQRRIHEPLTRLGHKRCMMIMMMNVYKKLEKTRDWLEDKWHEEWLYAAYCTIPYLFFVFCFERRQKRRMWSGTLNSHKPPENVFLGWPRFFLSTTKALLERMLPQSTWSSRYYDIKTIAYHSP